MNRQKCDDEEDIVADELARRAESYYLTCFS